MDGEATRTALAQHTRADALDDLRTALDLTRAEGAAFGVPDVEGEIRAALRSALRGTGTPVEALQRLRSRWVG